MTSSVVTELSGAQRPRVFHVPDAPDHRDAADAARLSGGYGLELDDWQQYVLDCWLARRRDGKWAASRCGLTVPRQNGKTAMLEVRELFGMTMLGERILHTAHEVKTARKAFTRLLEFFDNPRAFPELHALLREPPRRANGQEGIFLKNGGSIEFVARSKGAARGFTVDVLVADEAQEFGEDKLAALLPTISAAPQGNPQTILTGTPPSPVMDGTVFTRMRQAALEGKDKRLCWLEWSGETVEEANPALGYRLSMETVEDERASMDPVTFARERRGVWDEFGAGGALRGWAALATDEIPLSKPKALGIAADASGFWYSLGAYGESGFVGPVDRRRAEHGRAAFVAGVAAAALKHRVPVAVGTRGMAGVLIGDLRKAGVRVVETTFDDLVQASADFADAVDTAAVSHGAMPELDAAVNASRWRNVGDRRALDVRGTDVSMLEAVVLARHIAGRKYDVMNSIY